MEIEQCNEGPKCKKSIENVGPGKAKCSLCRLSPSNTDTNGLSSYWSPTDKKFKHPTLVSEKLVTSRKRRLDSAKKKLDRDRTKMTLARMAKQSEEASSKAIVKATKNSGRINKDGDAVALGAITLDYKLQSTSVDWTVKLEEMVKVKNDAKRGGNEIGVLVVKNKNGSEIVAMDVLDFARILAKLKGLD